MVIVSSSGISLSRARLSPFCNERIPYSVTSVAGSWVMTFVSPVPLSVRVIPSEEEVSVYSRGTLT